MPHGFSTPEYITRSKLYQGRFGRMFRHLPYWAPGGDTFFDLSKSQQEEVVRSLVIDQLKMIGSGQPNAENPDIPAAYTYFGQFVDHDMTFDPMSVLARRNDPDELVNFRTPFLDLDNVYGRGPDDQPYLYEGSKFRIGDNGNNEEDLPRLIPDTEPAAGKPRPGVALIGDKRNDENIIVSQLQLAFLKLHNMIFESLPGSLSDRERFKEAHRKTRWHYQWVVLHDYAKRLCGNQTIDRMLNLKGGNAVYEGPDLTFYDPRNNKYMPVEFSVAAYRLGHSMIRDSYNLSDKLDGFTNGNPIPIFVGKKDQDVGELEDLRGARRLPGVWTIQWDRFVEFQGSTPQASMKLDPILSDPLADLPEILNQEIPVGSPIANLAIRNVLRGIALRLPSGQAIAKRMGFKPLDGDELPLWVYVLREAETAKQGKSLGPVGSRIVGEVFVGLIANDPDSFLKLEPEWKPDLIDGKFDLADLLNMSGAPMTATAIS